MSATTAPSRQHAAAGQARRPAACGPAAGRFRGDLATDQWWWSPELHALLGLATGSVRPSVEGLLSAVHPDDRPAVGAALATASRTGAPSAREHRVLLADGSARPVLLVCEPEVDPDGTVTALTGLVLDLTGSRPAADDDEQLRHLETEVEQLRSAMASRASIEQAKGILMLLMGCGDQVAFDLLAHISSHTHRKVREVAVAIVESASGRSQLPDDVREILHDACPPARSTV
ncbi:PAS and ANTAR domain-containing protein [Modestobacter italicus]|uniref:PAS and ANTAR domain-containing protein n=1 Tax=Modestobacter italicus (strain DSM 44449 / CECT 9708 / BC 501) TaxID=2732864 RepID=UPI001C975839|nr:PAS and ANTAR domain-containing protein [Modestobacter italicus]